MSGHASRRCLGCTSARLLVSDEHTQLHRTVLAIDQQCSAHARGHLIVAQLAPPWRSSQRSMTFVPSLSTGSISCTELVGIASALLCCIATVGTDYRCQQTPCPS